MPIIDPEFEKWIPAPTKKEHESLESLIVAEGCRDPIVTWNDIIIDGHTRYNICEANDIPYKTKAMDFPDRNAAMAWMIRNQQGRRNLTPSQNSMLTAKLATLLRGERAKSANLHTMQEASDDNGVSRRSVASAKNVQASPVKELSRMVIDGEVPVSVAEQASKQPEAKVRQAVKKGPEAVKALAKAVEDTGKFDHLPEVIRPAFEEAGIFDEILNHLAQVSKLFNQATGGNDLRMGKGTSLKCATALVKDFQDGTAKVKDLRHFFSSRKPENICVYCRAKPHAMKACTVCLGSGFSTKFQWGRATENMRNNEGWNK